MARVAVLSGAAILDTSWLLELYRVPDHFKKSRTSIVRDKTADLVEAKFEMFVTIPVLFETAGHIAHVHHGGQRRELGKRLRDDIRTSIDRDMPWTIAKVESDILVRLQDLMELAERFLESSGPNYSFADISIIDLAEVLRRSKRTVNILAFDQQLESYSD